MIEWLLVKVNLNKKLRFGFDMSDHKDSSAAATMDTNSERERKDKDSLGEMINSAAMSILDGEDFTMGPVQVK